MNRLVSDISYAFRHLARAPGFAATAIITLALGIGANTAIFSLVKTVLIRPLPYGNPERLTMLWGKMEKGATTWLSGPEVRAQQCAATGSNPPAFPAGAVVSKVASVAKTDQNYAQRGDGQSLHSSSP